jgi:hypothetical protein
MTNGAGAIRTWRKPPNIKLRIIILPSERRAGSRATETALLFFDQDG